MLNFLKEIGRYTIISYGLAIIFNAVGEDGFKDVYYIELLIICFSITISFITVNYVLNFGEKISEYSSLKRSIYIVVDVIVCTFCGLLISKLFFYLFMGSQFSIMSNSAVIVDSLIIALIITVLAFTYFILKDRIEKAQLKMHDAEKEKLRFEKLKVEAELQSVQGKLNPHFLFNSLNSIASLIRKNPENAEQMTLKLSDLFRDLIDNDIQTMHTIDDEYRMLKNYLEIEKIRFGDRLKFEFIQEIQANITIPKLILQPLIENAIKHVISKYKDGGTIRIHSYQTEFDCVFEIEDTGPGFDLSLKKGYGLTHIQDRLNLIYGSDYNIETSQNDHFKIIIKLLNQIKPN